MIILAIETSCDETAVAIVNDKKEILANEIFSQIDLHKKYGGVVPELAARSHAEIIDVIILQALEKSGKKFEDIDAFAATAGPGLIGGLMVGVMAAKLLSSIYKKPFLAINHLVGHALTIRLIQEIDFDFLLLLFSGGHCQILHAKNYNDFEKIGSTIDDAIGECFDKVASMLGLEYPGGPKIEEMAKNGDENFYALPKPLIYDKKHPFNFSFSGLKTAVKRLVEKISAERELTSVDKANICASFQNTVAEIIINRLENIFMVKKLLVDKIVIAGGVAANEYIFGKLKIFALKKNLQIYKPPIHLCTDNGAMIAWAAIEKFRNGEISSLNFKPVAKWDLPVKLYD